MLVEFSVQNHRSFRNKQSFLMTAISGKSKNAVSTGNNGAPYVLQQACLFGANGSGKSGLIRSMLTVREIILCSFKFEDTLSENYEPHLFHSKWQTAPTEFEITFLYDNSLFQYGFVYDADRIWEEWLFERPNTTGRNRIVFTREYNPKIDNYDWGPKNKNIKGELQSWRTQTRGNALFISTAVQLNAESLKRPYYWLSRGLRMISGFKLGGNYTASRFEDETWKKKVMECMADTDLRLEDVEVKKKNTVDTSKFKNLPTEMQNHLKPLFLEQESPEVYTYRNNEKGLKKRLDFIEESTGTRSYFRLIGPILDSLDNGYTLIVDELNTHLHPLAFRYITRMFCSPKTNQKNAQLIFTTHDSTVTEEECIGREQIWLVEKGDDLSTHIIPLTDYKTLSNRSFQKAYLQGRYGAIPRLEG